MAWSSLSSNEIPTKSEVQEAINSAGFEVWRGKSYIANKDGSFADIFHNNDPFKSALISLEAHSNTGINSTRTVYAEKYVTHKYQMNAGDPYYFFTVYMSSTYIRVTKNSVGYMDDMYVRQILYLP